ncbi:MAG: hypothetical protein HY738_07465 [Bacteroidia bacterium]|nr:hypothetical protein [Bacteroidia bacterium]
MLRAGALYYTVFLSFLISLICFFFILESYYNNLYIENAVAREQLSSDVNAAVAIALADPQKVPPDSEWKTNVFNHGNNQVAVRKKTWGVYLILTAKATWRQYCCSKTALLGRSIIGKEPFTLYLADRNNYLSVCGRTLLKGTCYLPELGIKRAYIEGQSFTGSKLVDGDIKTSSQSLPEPDKKLINELNSYLNGEKISTDSIRYFEEYAASDTINNPFNNKTLVLLSSNRFNLEFKHITGNIIIFSDKPVTINSTVHITDVIIYAPSAVVKSGFSGKLQIITSDSLTVEQNCILDYPSFLGVFATLKESKNIFLHIERNCVICGGIMLYVDEQCKSAYAILSVKRGASVYGTAYSNTLTELQGNIYGNLCCEKFILKTPSSVYENHLLNTTIDITGIPSYFAGPVLFDNNEKEEIIKWLY